jgi:hypothetical protein
MAAPLQPEFFLLLGIDLFIAISLLSCLLDKHFPWQLPYLYQVTSLAGFGQLIVAKEFMALFGDYTRFWFSIIYLIVALANIVAINLYLGIIKKLLNYAKAFLVTISFPLFRYSHIFPHKLLRRHDTSHRNISAGLRRSHLHRQSRLRHLRGRLRHIPLLQTKMVVHRHRLRLSNHRRNNIRNVQAQMEHRRLRFFSHSPRHSLHDSSGLQPLHSA